MDDQHVLKLLASRESSETDWESILLNCELGAVCEVLQIAATEDHGVAARSMDEAPTFDRWRSIWKAKGVDIGEVRIRRKALFRREKIERLVNSPKLWLNPD